MAFFTGVGQFIPQPGTTISEVTVVRIKAQDSGAIPSSGNPALTHNDPWITKRNTPATFLDHLAAVGRASEVQAADKRWQAEKPTTTRPTSSSADICYEFRAVRSCRSTDRPRGGLCRHGHHLTLETDRLHATKLPAEATAFGHAGSTCFASPLRHLPFRHGDRRRA